MSLVAKEHGAVFLSVERAVIYPFFHRMKEEFKGDFPALDVHFTIAGPFPFSHELNDAFVTLNQSEAICYIGGAWILTARHDTQEVLEEELAKYFGQDEKKRERFLEFVSRFNQLIEN